jgi:hypothetical protein
MNTTESNSNAAALAGGVEGVEVEVTLKSAAKETVLVRELPFSAYPKLGDAIMDEERQVEIYCDKPAGWAAQLKPKSHNAVMTAGDELNKDAFFGWLSRKVNLALVEKGIAPSLIRLQPIGGMKAAVTSAETAG